MADCGGEQYILQLCMLYMEHVLDVMAIAETQFLDEREWALMSKKHACIDTLVKTRVESLLSACLSRLSFASWCSRHLKQNTSTVQAKASTLLVRLLPPPLPLPLTITITKPKLRNTTEGSTGPITKLPSNSKIWSGVKMRSDNSWRMGSISLGNFRLGRSIGTRMRCYSIRRGSSLRRRERR